MSNNIRAIQTSYKGYRFRSRLEARWAVFFDALGLEWKYETEGYEREFDGDVIRYLPDFVLRTPDYRKEPVFAEVKGDPEGLRSEWDKQAALHDFGGCLPGFSDSVGSNRGLILLGDIPLVKDGSTAFHPIIQHQKGLERSWVTFTTRGAHVVFQREEIITGLCQLDTDYGLDSSADDWLVETRIVTFPGYYSDTCNAYQKARAARFEYGEKG